MKAIIFTLLFFGSSFSFAIEELKTVTIPGGTVFNFITTYHNVDCNGTGYTGVELDKTFHDTENKVKTYNVYPTYGPVTLIWCPGNETVEEVSIDYQTKEDEVVSFVIPANMEIVIK